MSVMFAQPMAFVPSRLEHAPALIFGADVVVPANLSRMFGCGSKCLLVVQSVDAVTARVTPSVTTDFSFGTPVTSGPLANFHSMVPPFFQELRPAENELSRHAPSGTEEFQGLPFT
ncbi:hypothetical protein F8566_10100 [Actinomadura rudentiformis]|uniref:Uncharacterized protein n=1 Tax=Actinomadura rudentiformis TaxID=359158 RepID=A0A6H9Z585_9ACTN|nr:hypothetical protein F8566_10100 [Actinomadura rudentiformis]